MVGGSADHGTAHKVLRRKARGVFPASDERSKNHRDDAGRFEALLCRHRSPGSIIMQDLWQHQKEGVARATPLPAFGFFFEAGTGKTRTTIEVFRQKCATNGRLLKTLILAPQVVLQNWRNEILKFSKIGDQDIVVLRGTGQQRADLIYKHNNKPTIFIANYETLLMEKCATLFNGYGFECIIADESHRIKNHSSKRTKALLKLSKGVQYKYILTGTPVLQSPLDLFSQFQFLDGGQTFEPVGTNYFAFQRHFFFNKNAGAPSHVTWPDWRIREGATEEISQKIGRVTMHVKKSECLDLPPMVKKTIPVELSTEQRRHYEMMKKNFITFLGDKACTASLAITKGLRLQQIVSGFITLEDETIVPMKANPRLDALEELLEDLVVAGKHKVIIWACWKENYKQIRELLYKLGIKYVEAHGEIPQKNRQEAIDDFCHREEIKVFLGNQGAAGIGINLVQASYAIYYSRNFSLEHDIQSEARNYRGGSEIHESVTRIDLVAQGTIDESILLALASKQEIGDKVLRDMAATI